MTGNRKNVTGGRYREEFTAVKKILPKRKEEEEEDEDLGRTNDREDERTSEEEGPSIGIPNAEMDNKDTILT